MKQIDILVVFSEKYIRKEPCNLNIEDKKSQLEPEVNYKPNCAYFKKKYFPFNK